MNLHGDLQKCVGGTTNPNCTVNANCDPNTTGQVSVCKFCVAEEARLDLLLRKSVCDSFWMPAACIGTTKWTGEPPAISCSPPPAPTPP